jgi:release factor glutamine methyltransferase
MLARVIPDTVVAGPLYDQLLQEVRGFFQPQGDKPEETPEAVLHALWFAAAGRPVSLWRVGSDPLPALEPEHVQTLKALVARKREGVPLAHITGRQEFLGLELLAGPDALIPRKETEILGRAAIAELQDRSRAAEELLVMDVCTGCGNLALAYAHHAPKARVYAADLSEEAVELARRNARFTGLSERVSFAAGDLFAPFQDDARLLGKCDLVSCNPPYITSAKVPKMGHEISAHEPKLAFDGGALGLSIVTRLFLEAPKFLKPGGALCFEMGAGQGTVLEGRLRRQPWVANVEVHKDSSGVIRAMVATRIS